MSSVVASNEPEAAAPRAGADLRAARERIGWSIEDLATWLRIRHTHLEALEDGRIGDLPGNAYALAFLRTYATALGLDSNEMSRRFKAEAAEVTRKTELDFPVPVPERGVPAGAVVLLGVVLAIGAYAGWYRLSGQGRLPAEATSVPARLATLAEQALPPLAAPLPTFVAAAPPPASTPPSQSTSPSDAAAASVFPLASSAAPLVAPLAVPLAAASVSPSAAAAATTQPANVTASDQSRVLIRASATAWVEVRERGGAALYNRVLKPGETFAVPPRPNLVLATGNAGGTELLVDGVATPSLGKTGVVRRDLPLDPDLIKSGGLAPSAAAPAKPATPNGMAGGPVAGAPGSTPAGTPAGTNGVPAAQ